METSAAPAAPASAPAAAPRAPILCAACGLDRAAARRASTGRPLCRTCFCRDIEDDVGELVRAHELLRPGHRVAIAVSGGKDSAVLTRILTKLNARRADDGRSELLLLSIDEGIVGYRDGSLQTVEGSKVEYGLPLTILSFESLYGHTMDTIADRIHAKGSCSYCGVFRRQALDRGAAELGCSRLATGHNADDAAETLLMNLLRGDGQRLDRCRGATTDGGAGYVPRCKPLARLAQREVVLYARYEGVQYFATECPYATSAFRMLSRAFIKELESIRPAAVLDIVRSGEEMRVEGESSGAGGQEQQGQQARLGRCPRCGYVTSQAVCHACTLVEALSSDKPLQW